MLTWSVFKLRVKCIQVASEMYSSCEWSIFKLRLKCIQVASEMYSSCEWNVFKLRVKCIQVASEMYSSCEWNVFKLRVKCIQVASDAHMAWIIKIFSFNLIVRGYLALHWNQQLNISQILAITQYRMHLKETSSLLALLERLILSRKLKILTESRPWWWYIC